MRCTRIVQHYVLLLLTICCTSGPATAQPLKLYWADEFAGRVYKSNPDGTNLETLITGDYLDSEEAVLGGGKLYWSDVERGLIQRVNTDGSDLETVILTPEPGALGLDIGSGKLYWVDNALGEIRRANLDGTSPEPVESLAHPATALTVSESNQFIIWAEYDASLLQSIVQQRAIGGGATAQIVVVQGTARVRGLVAATPGSPIYFGYGSQLLRTVVGAGVIALYSGGVNITGVAIDETGGKLYWSDDGNSDVTRSNLDGSGPEILETFARNVDGIAVDSAGAKLFWTEERYVVRSELDGTGQVNIVTRPSYFAVGFHESLQRIYYSDLHDLETFYASSIDGSGETPFWSGVSGPTGGALAIQVDQSADKVYWLDGGDRWLRRADLDGSGREDLFYLANDAYDIALDLPGGRVYWCGRATGSIFRRNLDGSGVTETLFSGLNLPRGLALDHVNGRVLWGEDDQIAGGAIDGGGPIAVCFTDPFAVIGVVWDGSEDRLYWADQLNSRVRRAEYDVVADTWSAPETLFSMGFEHWPGRLVLQYGVTSGVDEMVVLPQEHYAQPNPFNPFTEIHFRTTEASAVTVGVYGVDGALVRELQRETWRSAGPQRVRWDGTDDAGRVAASGVYMYLIEAGAERLVGKLVMLK